jgi:predicted phosphodiesterase
MQMNKQFFVLVFILSSLMTGASTYAPLPAYRQVASRTKLATGETVPDLTATSAPIRFGVIGDYGDGSEAEADVANLVKSWNPDFIITTGDNNYPDGAASTIDAHIGQFYHEFIYPYRGTYGSGATTNLFFPTLGNNDWDTLSAKAYFDYFTLPGNERYYDYVWGPVHFFVIDSADREPDGNSSSSTQATWLHNQLAASTSAWNVVYLHHPPYTSGSVTSNTTLQWPYASWGADVVMSGHSHTYERIFRDGIVYFVNGLGGDSIQSFSSTISGSQRRYNGDFGAMLVDADTSQMTFQFINRGGTLIDSYSLHKPSAFSKINPSNGALDQARDVTLSWGTSDNAASYQYCIDKVNDNACNGSWISSGATSKALSNLSLNTTYYWQVRAINDTGTTTADDGAWWSFTTVAPCYTLTKSVNPPGSGVINASPPPNCNGGTQYTAGTNVQLTASANPGTDYIFDYWSGNMVFTSTNPLSVMITGDTAVTANFKEPTQSFEDVPTNYWAWDYIERLYSARVTSGCSTSPLLYCPTSSVTRDQMAVFLLRAKHGANYIPPKATGTFEDVPTDYWAADWIEQLADEGITSGCSTSPRLYCPSQEVSRDQMAVFLLRAKHVANYAPPKATGVFQDVPVTYWAADWIEQLAAEGVTGGCSTNPLKYCPGTPVTRDQMAVFLVKNFNLP